MNIKNPKIRMLIDFIMLAAGAAVAAFAIEEFLVPCTILDGGVIGIGIMVNNLTHIPLSILTIALNVPFPVSYTHLDVYKRQGLPLFSGTGSCSHRDFR